jgi:hypothetical protein
MDQRTQSTLGPWPLGAARPLDYPNARNLFSPMRETMTRFESRRSQ